MFRNERGSFGFTDPFKFVNLFDDMSISAPPGTSSDELTVTVFQQGLVARTFRIQRSWFYKLSFSALVLVLLTTASVWIAVRYFRIATRLDPTRLHDLELEMSDLRAQNRALEQRATDLETAQKGALPITSEALPPSADLPAPTVTVTVTAAAPPAPDTPTIAPIAGGSYLFAALPANVQAPPDRATLPFALKESKVRWSGNLLRVRFALQYTLAGGGSQQGRLVLLARGKDTLQVYPNGAFSPSGQGPLIRPDRGESFSVSRYREVKAEFGPAKTRESFQEVEAMVFDNQGALLIHERFVPEKDAPKAASPSPNMTQPGADASAPAGAAPVTP